MTWSYYASRFDQLLFPFLEMLGNSDFGGSMGLFRLLAHTALASVFISGGMNALKDPKPLAAISDKTIKQVGKPVARITGSNALVDADAVSVVRANGIAQILGGIGLATGILRRPAALGLIASLIPVTLAGHPFWKMKGNERVSQQVQFTKNMGLLGGLALVATQPRKKKWFAWGGTKPAKPSMVDANVKPARTFWPF